MLLCKNGTSAACAPTIARILAPWPRFVPHAQEVSGRFKWSAPARSPTLFGMKSYGRAPTFLMRTGYEQARSVVSAIAGDWDAARRVDLVLPETGVCSTDPSGDAASSCCGTVADAQFISGSH